MKNLMTLARVLGVIVSISMMALILARISTIEDTGFGITRQTTLFLVDITCFSLWCWIIWPSIVLKENSNG